MSAYIKKRNQEDDWIEAQRIVEALNRRGIL